MYVYMYLYICSTCKSLQAEEYLNGRVCRYGGWGVGGGGWRRLPSYVSQRATSTPTLLHISTYEGNQADKSYEILCRHVYTSIYTPRL
jgi:hypothetical protein